MPRIARKKSGTGIYHVMLRGINRQDIFEDAEDYWTFIRALSVLPDRLCDDLQSHMTCCHIYAYCLMPNHVHLLLHEADWTIGQCVKLLADIYVRYYNKKHGRTGHLLQDRFKSEPCDTIEYFVTLLRYIHQNPVKAGLVEQVKDYQYSSWGNDYHMLGSIQVCSTNVVLRRIPYSELEALVNEPLPATQLCLDIPERQTIIDSDIRQYIVTKHALRTITDLQLYTRERQVDILRDAILQFKGLGPRQLSRVTGLNYTFCRKVFSL